MNKINGTIENAEIHKVNELWKRKPKGLGFEDTDAIVVSVKTNDGKTIRETFFTAIKPDGTFNQKTLSRSSDTKRLKLASFLIHYGITKDVKKYNIVEGIKDWKGRKVEVVKFKNTGFISIP